MKALRSFTLSEICCALDVSRSGFYARQNRPMGTRLRQDIVLKDQIRHSFRQSRSTYGARRIGVDLKQLGATPSRRRIRRLMLQEQLHPFQKRRFRPRTTDSRHDDPIAPNRLPALASQAPFAPNTAWVADITYLETREGWLYLAAVMDLASRRIVGWQVSDRIDSTLVETAFRRATRWRSVPDLHHSDRGCQYTAGSFRSLLKQCNVQSSMSRRANCYDNAAMESFWATLKAECFSTSLPETRALATTMIFDYIDGFYNTRRRHSSLGYISPADYELSFIEKSPKSN